MLSWIGAFVGRWAAVVPQDVRDVIHWTAHALASVVYTVFGNVGKAWHDLLGALQWMHARADEFVSYVVGRIAWLVTVEVPRLAATALGYLRTALAFAAHIWSLAQAGLARLEGLARQWVKDALSWVAVHVWQPLDARLRQVAADLIKWGFYAYQLVTHPDQLAAILLGALIAAAESTFFRIAGPLGTFTLRLIMSALPRLLALAESVVTAVL